MKDVLVVNVPTCSQVKAALDSINNYGVDPDDILPLPGEEPRAAVPARTPTLNAYGIDEDDILTLPGD